MILTNTQHVCTANHFIYGSETKFCHYFTQILGKECEEVHDVIGISGKEFPQVSILCSNTNRASIQMTLAHHDTTFYHQGSRCNTPFFCTKQGRNRNITTGADLSVGLKHDATSQIIFYQCLMRFCKTKFPWQTSMTQ